MKHLLGGGISQLNIRAHCWKTLLLVVDREGLSLYCKANGTSLFVSEIVYIKQNGVLCLLVHFNIWDSVIYWQMCRQFLLYFSERVKLSLSFSVAVILILTILQCVIYFHVCLFNTLSHFFFYFARIPPVRALS